MFQTLAGGRYSPRAYKLGLFCCGLILLPCVLGGVVAAGLEAREWIPVVLLAWLYLWVGLPLSLWQSGLSSFVTASALVVLLFGWLLRFDRRPTWRVWLAIVLTGIAAFWSHVTAPIIAFGGLVGYLAAVGRRHSWRWQAALWGAAGLTLAANLVWLVPLWEYRGLRTGPGFFLTSGSTWAIPRYYLNNPRGGQPSLAILVLGALGLVSWWCSGRRPAAATIGGVLLVLLPLSAFGSLWEPTKLLEPVRFRLPLTLLLTLPAGFVAGGDYLKTGPTRRRLLAGVRARPGRLDGASRPARGDCSRALPPDQGGSRNEAAPVSLHWLDTWASDPPCPIAPEPIAGDPVGFVRITPPGPLPRLILENRYGRP